MEGGFGRVSDESKVARDVLIYLLPLLFEGGTEGFFFGAVFFFGFGLLSAAESLLDAAAFLGGGFFPLGLVAGVGDFEEAPGFFFAWALGWAPLAFFGSLDRLTVCCKLATCCWSFLVDSLTLLLMRELMVTGSTAGSLSMAMAVSPVAFSVIRECTNLSRARAVRFVWMALICAFQLETKIF